MDENEKESAEVYQFPDWAGKDKKSSQFSKKLKLIREMSRRASEKYNGNPGPDFWKKLKARIDHLKRDNSGQE